MKYQEIKTSLFVKDRIFHRTFQGQFVALGPDGTSEAFNLSLLERIVQEGKEEAQKKGIEYKGVGVVAPFCTGWQSHASTRDLNLAVAIEYFEGLLEYETQLKNDYH